MTLGERLHWLRKGEGWTLRDLEKRCDVSIAYLSELERGASPGLEVLERIADAYGLEVSELMAGVRIQSSANWIPNYDI